MKKQQAFIGLRSGGVLVITKGEGGVPEVDASQVTLNDVAAGIAGQNRFANQLHRQPYTVLEHSLIGSYLFDDPAFGIAYLFHDAAEGFGVCDLNWKIKLMYGTQVKRVEAAILEALAVPFNFVYPFPPEIKALDRILGAYELASLHPAAHAVAKGYGHDLGRLRTELDPAKKGIMDRWFARPPATLARQEELWRDRLQTLRTLVRDRRAVAVVRETVSRPKFLPYPASMLGAWLSHNLQLPAEEVRAELSRLEAQGVLVRRDSFYHLAESTSVALLPTASN